MSSDELVGRFLIGDLIKAGVISAHKDGNFGSLYPRIEDFGDDGFPLLTAKVVNGGRIDFGAAQKLRKEKAARLPYGFIQAGDVLLSHNATVGRVAVVPEFNGQALIGTSLTYFRLDTSRLLPRYLAGFFESRDFQNQLASVMGLSTRNQVPITAQRLLEVEVPPLKAQHRISEFIGALDDRIALLRETNATLEAIAQALFKSWFVDFDPVRAKQQGLAPAGMDEATAALFPDSFEESALGLVPSGWSVRQVEDVVKRVGMGPFGSNIKVSTFVEIGIPVLNGANVQGALLEDRDFRFVTEEHAGRLRNSCVRPGDIVLTHRGTLGQVALVPAGARFAEYVLSQSQFFLRCDASVMQPEWMLYFLRSPAGQHLLLSNASQVGVPAIARPSSHLKSIRLAVPPVEIVGCYAETVLALHASIVGNKGTAATLNTLRDTLLPRLISGQLRLPEAEALAA